MREKLIKKASSTLVAVLGMSLLLIFIAAMKHPQQKKVYSYLALGDSYTIGERVAPEENFPNQAIGLLRENGFDFAAPRFVAKTGWTTDELQAAILATKLERHYDFVTLLAGVNNQYRGLHVADYREEFEALLRQAIDFTGNIPERVIVLSIPDWSAGPFAEGRDREKISGEIDSYNKVNRALAEKYHVQYIDITPGAREAATDAALLADDGLHPSGKEYSKWAVKIAAIIRSQL